MLGISQSKLSAKMFLSRTTCGQWERGKACPSIVHLTRLSELLGVSFEWLATGREVMMFDDKNEDLKKPEQDEKQAEQEQMKRHKQKVQMNNIFETMNLKQRKYLLSFLDSMRYRNSADNSLQASAVSR
jgi:transcriptional regulator with XRE-family HTH domain